jgi:hypothetical protein
MRRFLLIAVAALIVAAFAAGPASAASNPSGTGQPSAECGDPGATLEPTGFGTGGFANAEDHYADGGANNNPSAVSQYDVACFQFTSSH